MAGILNFPQKWKNTQICFYLLNRSEILSKFSTPRVTFYKNHFPATFGGHLEFLREMLKTLISETVRDRVILTKFFVPQDICRVYWQLFRKTCFPATFGSHLEFLCKAQNRIHLGNGLRQSDFDKILDPQGICRVYWRHFAKITLPPFFGGHLEFMRKTQSTFIWQTVRDRVVSTKFLTCRLSAEFTGGFSQKSLSHHFWRPS